MAFEFGIVQYMLECNAVVESENTGWHDCIGTIPDAAQERVLRLA
jgi:hypothetical protein